MMMMMMSCYVNIARCVLWLLIRARPSTTGKLWLLIRARPSTTGKLWLLIRARPSTTGKLCWKCLKQLVFWLHNIVKRGTCYRPSVRLSVIRACHAHTRFRLSKHAIHTTDGCF